MSVEIPFCEKRRNPEELDIFQHVCCQNGERREPAQEEPPLPREQVRLQAENEQKEPVEDHVAEIQAVAESQGMISMREDGYLKALTAKTTLAEVNRVAATDSA